MSEADSALRRIASRIVQEPTVAPGPNPDPKRDPGGSTEPGRAQDTTQRTSNEVDEKGKLLRAAPDLLEACRATVEMIAALYPLGRVDPAWLKHALVVKAAIEKATR